MHLFRLIEKLVGIASRVTWTAILVHLAVLYALGALLLRYLEPTDSGFNSLLDYSWWFLVTITTVGYGDMAPVTGAGRMVAALIMVFGIGAIGAALGKLGDTLFKFGRKRMRGLIQLDREGHIVILGYRKGETEQIVREILADPNWEKRPIVLCAEGVEENPMPDQVEFVQGELTSDDVLTRACVDRAEGVIIHCRDDSQTIVTAIAVNAANTRAHIVAHLENEENEKHLRRISPQIECVIPLSVPMIVQALQDPGITRVVQALLSNVMDDVFYRIDVPQSISAYSFGHLVSSFKQKHGVILLAVADSTESDASININPDSDFRVRGGMSLFYVGSERLGAIDWGAL